MFVGNKIKVMDTLIDDCTRKKLAKSSQFYIWVYPSERGIYYGRSENSETPPPLNFFEILPCFLRNCLAAYIHIKQGNKIRIVSLFFTPISRFHFKLIFKPFFHFFLFLIPPSKFFLFLVGGGGLMPRIYIPMFRTMLLIYSSVPCLPPGTRRPYSYGAYTYGEQDLLFFCSELKYILKP